MKFKARAIDSVVLVFAHQCLFSAFASLVGFALLDEVMHEAEMEQKPYPKVSSLDE